MSTFQGFNILRIDRNSLPLPEDDEDILYNQFLLLLQPIDAYPNTEEQKLWGYCFRREIKDSNNSGGADRETSLPKLDFIPIDDNAGVICASEVTLASLGRCLPHIIQLVEQINQKFRWLIDGRNRIRVDIDKINVTHFANPDIVLEVDVY